MRNVALAVVAFSLLIHAAVLAADVQCSNDQTLLTVSFGRLMTDSEVDSLLARHSATPYGLFLWSSGIAGSHRVAAANVSAATAGARRVTAKMFGDALDGLVYRAGRFVQQHSREQVVANADLAEKARALLRRWEQHSSIVAAARTQKPLIYAVAVCSDAATHATLSADRALHVARAERPARGAAHPERPQSLHNRFRAPRIESLTAGEVYDRVVALSRKTRQEN